MIEDLLNEINQIVKEEDNKESSADIPAGVKVGNISGSGHTIVIGGNVNQGRRKDDKPGASNGCHARRASDRKLYKEIRQLRRQVESLLCLVEGIQKKPDQCLVTSPKPDPESGFKQSLKARSDTTSKCRTPSVKMADFFPIYVTSPVSNPAPANRSETRTIIDSFPFNLIHSRIIPFVSPYLTSHTTPCPLTSGGLLAIYDT